MPRVKLDYIVSFSSEDPDNPASNLLNWEVSKKRWLCSKGEPSCSVVLQLAKAVKISEIHIGAHNVAFVEVLAGRSEKPNESFQVIVASSIFLSPSESRGAGDGSSGLERVRSFPWSQLQPGAAAQRWDRVRVLCSQPYNKHCKYGLSFVQIYEPEGSHRPTLVLPTITGDDDDEDDDFKPGELFAAHNTSITTDTGSQIRHATSQALKNISNSSTKLVKTPITKRKRSEHANEECSTDRRRSNLMYTDDDERPHAKIDHIVQRHKDEKCKQEPSSSKKAKQSDTKKNASSKNVTTEDSDKRKEKPSDSETGKDERLVGNGSDKHTSKNIKKEYTRTGKSQDEETDSSRKLKHVKKTDNGRDSRFDKGSPTPSREEKRKYTNNDQPSTSRVNESFNTKKRSREKPEKGEHLVHLFASITIMLVTMKV
ncbi:hypothetical protein evm_011554 [Chilo suppressalis]|nr:hypothetical protein evm_011554 [Chilo suppressalis]